MFFKSWIQELVQRGTNNAISWLKGANNRAGARIPATLQQFERIPGLANLAFLQKQSPARKLEDFPKQKEQDLRSLRYHLVILDIYSSHLLYLINNYTRTTTTISLAASHRTQGSVTRYARLESRVGRNGPMR